MVHRRGSRGSVYRVSLACVMAAGALTLAAGCGSTADPPLPPLFAVPFVIEGGQEELAIVDTGGGYEVMLRHSFGLDVVETVEVVAFGGRQTVEVTEGFAYTAGGIAAVADEAIIGTGICDCNGIGFHFFRKTGVVLGLDFTTPSVAFQPLAPSRGVRIEFAPFSAERADFDTSFLNVRVSHAGNELNIWALLDTGANTTIMRDDVAVALGASEAGFAGVTLAHDPLGAITVNARLSDNPALPEMILGTDTMRRWGDQWYFSFDGVGGTITVVNDDDGAAPPIALQSASR